MNTRTNPSSPAHFRLKLRLQRYWQRIRLSVRYFPANILYFIVYCWYGYLRTSPMHTALARTMVLAPHPDDESIGCGGLIAARAKENVPVQVVVFTDGRYGGEIGVCPEDLVVTRLDELNRALHALGVAAPAMALGYQDKSLSRMDHETRKILVQRLAEEIARFQPDEIFAPSPQDVHKDHEAVLPFLLEALELSRQPRNVYLYFIWSFWHLQRFLSASSIRPKLFLDISEHALCKDRAIREHASQRHHLPLAIRYSSVLLRRELFRQYDFGSSSQ